jgi:tetratricopeptide (TPR) repeat protein
MSLFSQIPIALLGVSAIVVYADVAQAATADTVRQTAQTFAVRIDGQNPGSGFIVARDGNTYFVLTAKHVVATEDEYVIVAPDGQAYDLDYRTVEHLPGVDLALLKFESDREYAVATLADYAADKQERYILISGWNATDDALPELFTAGQIIDRDFELAVTRHPQDSGYKLFYTNVTEKGMSGGPILDTQGRVIGVHGQSDGQQLYDETLGVMRVKLGFSAGIPMNIVLRAIAQSAAPPDLQVVTTEPTDPNPREIASLRPFLGVSQPPQNGNAVDWSNWGNHLYRTQQFPAALRAFDRAIELKSDFYPAWYQRGNVLYALGDEMAAIGSFDRALDANPDFYYAWRDRGALLAAMGDLETAMESFDRAVDIQPDDHVVWYMRGNLLTQNFQRYDDAIDSYDRALAVNPDFAPAWMGKGKALSELGESDRALAALQKAIELDPEFGVAWILQGNVLHDLGRSEDALAAYDRAVEFTPNSAQLWLKRGQLLAEKRRYAEALQSLERSRQLDPNNPEVFDWLSQIQQLRH